MSKKCTTFASLLRNKRASLFRRKVLKNELQNLPRSMTTTNSWFNFFRPNRKVWDETRAFSKALIFERLISIQDVVQERKITNYCNKFPLMYTINRVTF